MYNNIFSKAYIYIYIYIYKQTHTHTHSINKVNLFEKSKMIFQNFFHKC